MEQDMSTNWYDVPQLPTPTVNAPKQRRKRGPVISERLEGMFASIDVNLSKNSNLMSGVLDGINAIKENTAKASGDNDALDKLRNSKKEESSTPAKGARDSLSDTLKGLAIGASLGGLSSAIGPLAAAAGAAVLAISFAAPIGDFVSTLIGRVVGNLTENQEIGNAVAVAVKDNLKIGLISGVLFGKKFGVVTTIVGSMLNSIAGYFGNPKLDLGFGEFNMNSNSIKLAMSGAMMMIAPPLLKAVGGAIFTSLTGPVGLIALGAGAVGLAAAAVMKFADEWAANKKVEYMEELNVAVEGGLKKLKEERAKSEGIFGFGNQRETEKALNDLINYGYGLHEKTVSQGRAKIGDWMQGDFKNRYNNNARTNKNFGADFLEYDSPLEYIEGIHTEAQKAQIAKSKEATAKLLNDFSQFDGLTEGELAKLATLASMHGFKEAESEIKQRLSEFLQKNPILSDGIFGATRTHDTDITLTELRDSILHGDAKNAITGYYDKNGDNARASLRFEGERTAYDKMLTQLVDTYAKGQDSQLSTILRNPNSDMADGVLRGMTSEERAAFVALRSEKSPVSIMMPNYSPSSTNIREGDKNIVTHVYNNGLGASSELGLPSSRLAY